MVYECGLRLTARFKSGGPSLGRSPGAHKQRRPVHQDQIQIFGEIGSTQFLEQGLPPCSFFFCGRLVSFAAGVARCSPGGFALAPSLRVVGVGSGVAGAAGRGQPVFGVVAEGEGPVECQITVAVVGRCHRHHGRVSVERIGRVAHRARRGRIGEPAIVGHRLADALVDARQPVENIIGEGRHIVICVGRGRGFTGQGISRACAPKHRTRPRSLRPDAPRGSSGTAARITSEIQKFRLPTDPNQFTDSRRPVPSEGRCARHQRGTGCGGRGRRDGRIVLTRTVKSCGSDAEILGVKPVKGAQATVSKSVVTEESAK